jgi:radical SAM protein with 4Fe4S-binding SPASM domain
MAGRPKVHSVAVELTAHCNQKCSYCYNAWREDDGAAFGASDRQLLVARVRRLCQTLDVDHFTITGGEPFSRAEIWDVLDALREHGIRAQIISNGGLVTERIAARLRPYRVLYVQVTLNGPDAELHEEHVGKGHFEPTLRGVRALRAHGVPVVGCVVVTRKNAAVLDRILALWSDLGVKQVALSRFSPAGYAASHAAELLPSLGDLTAAFDHALPFAKDGMHMSCTMPVPPCMLETADYAPIEFGACPIGTSMQELALGPDGRLRNCTLHQSAIGGGGDVADEGVDPAALLRHADVTAYRKRLPTFCEGCVHAPTCGGGCGAAAEWVLGLRDDKRLPDPVLWQHVDDELGARLERERDGRRRLQVLL